MAIHLKDFDEVLGKWDPSTNQKFHFDAANETFSVDAEHKSDQLQTLKKISEIIVTREDIRGIDAEKLKTLVTHLRDEYLEKYNSKWFHPIDKFRLLFL